MAKNIKILIIIFLLCLISILVLFYISIKRQPENKPEPVKFFSPSPTPILTPGLAPTSTPETKIPSFSKDPVLFNKQIAAQPAITNLIPILPYQGQYFTLDYSLHDFLFILKLDQNNRKAGMDEFEQFLRQHNIEGSSLFTNLVII